MNGLKSITFSQSTAPDGPLNYPNYLSIKVCEQVYYVLKRSDKTLLLLSLRVLISTVLGKDDTYNLTCKYY